MEQGKNNKQGKLLVVVGASVIVLAIVADWIGLGGREGFGFKQLALLLIGIIFIFYGRKKCQ